MTAVSSPGLGLAKHKAILGAGLLAAFGATALLLREKRRRASAQKFVKSEMNGQQGHVNGSQADGHRAEVSFGASSQGGSSASTSLGAERAAEVRKEALRLEEKATDEPSSGCGRNQGPLAGWQDKFHASSLAANETLLALRGGSPSARSELRQITELLATAERTLMDAIYCTGKEAQIAWLATELEPLLGNDPSSKLLHPLTGEAMRQQLIDALSCWEDHEPAQPETS